MSSDPSSKTPTSGDSSTSGAPSAGAPAAKTTTLDAAQGARVKRILVPLIQAMDHPRALNQVKVGVIDDQQINAASAGGGEFYVTTGLLQKADDQQLMAVLDQIFPGTGQVAPVAGALITRSYSRTEEYEADRHGVTLLNRIGQRRTP